MRRSRLGAAGIIGVLAVLTAGAAAAGERASVKIARHLELALEIPASMHVVSTERAEGITTIEIGPADGTSFQILLSAIPIAGKDQPATTEEEVQALVRIAGTEALASARETELKVFRLQGEASVGFLYALTDGRDELPDGEYRYMCQGFVLLDAARLSATLLSDSASPERMKPFLELLRTSRTVRR